MSRYQKSVDQKRRIALKTGARALGWDDSTLEDYLATHGATARNGRISSLTMNSLQLAAALDGLRQKGFLPHRGGKMRHAGERVGVATPDQQATIRHLWRRLHQVGAVRNPDEPALRAWIKRWSRPKSPGRQGYSSVELLPKPAAAQLIEALKAWGERYNLEWKGDLDEDRERIPG